MRVCPECKRTFGEETARCPHDRTELLDIADEPEGFVLERDQLQRLDGVKAADSRFTILEKIGQGGWGGVYKAYQHSTRREVALKVLRKDVAQDNQARRRFHREAEAVSKLKHPNTVTVFDFGETADGLLFIAMEYVEGRSLDAVIREEGPLTPLRTVRIARQVALSLFEAHNKGIVHRDIKPPNVMLTSHGDGTEFVKVLDFGVAKLASVESALTSTGSTFGTPEYMSPEQVQSKDVDHRSDLYALGVVMYEMLSGKPPFTGNSAVTVALSHIRKRPPPIRPGKGLPRPLLGLLKRLLAKSPVDRPASAQHAARELERIEHLLGSAPPPRRRTEVVNQIVGTVSANWGAALTVLAVVCMLSVALVVVREHLSGEEQSEDAAEVATALAPVAAAPAEPDTWSEPDVRVEAEVKERHEQAATTSPVVRLDVSHGEDVSVVPLAALSPDLVSEVRRLEFARPPPVERYKEPPTEKKAEKEEGVATAEARTEATIRIVTNVNPVRVKEGKSTVCRKSPCVLTARPGELRQIRVKREGYQTERRALRFEPGEKTVEIKLERESLSSRDGLKGATPPSDEDGLK